MLLELGAKAKAKAKANTGVLRCAQDDGERRAIATATAEAGSFASLRNGKQKEQVTARAKAKACVLVRGGFGGWWGGSAKGLF